MKKSSNRLILLIVSFSLGILLTALSIFFINGPKPFTIKTAPYLCMGPDVIGYECPDVMARATGKGRGFPFTYIYKDVLVQKQNNFMEPKTIRSGGFNTKAFLLNIVAWAVVANFFIFILRRHK